MSEGLAPGDVVGRFEVVGPLGEGGMGSVYVAARADLLLRVALKVMHPALRERAEACTRFVREARVLAALRHPHVVDVVDFGVDPRHGPWIAMRLLDGESLRDKLEREGAQTPSAVMSWALPVAAALHHAHGAGVVHRDLKPDNVFLARAEGGLVTPTVIDFGVAQAAPGGPITESGVLIGTPLYMAPEQLWGARHATARSDQYALALIAYEALCGALPFEAESIVEVVHRVELGGFPSVRERAPETPVALSDAVMRALAKSPDARFDDLVAFARALLPFASPADRARWSPVFSDDAPPPEPEPLAPAPTLADEPASSAPAATRDAPSVVAAAPSVPPPAPAPRRARWVALTLAALALAFIAARARREPVVETAPPPPREAPTPAAPTAPAAAVDAPASTDAAPPRIVLDPPVPQRPTPRVRARPRPAPPPPAPVAPASAAPTPPARGANGAPIRY